MDLNIAVTDASGSDIDPKDLCSELQIFSNIVPDSVSSSLDALRFIYGHGLTTAVPNVAIALRIALTILITVASGERSFSKLKSIKKLFENDNDARTPEQSGNDRPIYRTRYRPVSGLFTIYSRLCCHQSTKS